jgi:hypothetical protein
MSWWNSGGKPVRDGTAEDPARAWGRLDWVQLAVLPLLCAAFLWRQLFLGEVWHSMDFAPQIYPHLQWVHEKLASSLPPVWSQDLKLGYPFLDEGLSGYFYLPQRILLTFFGSAQALPLLYLFHFWLAGLGSYLFARKLGLGPWPAMLAAITTAFGGGMVYSQHHYVNFCSLAWLPWHFLGLEFVLSKTARQALIGSLLLGLSFAAAATGGHLVITVYGALALLIYTAFRLQGGFTSGIRRLASWAPLSLALFAMLALPQLLMTRRMVGQSIRQGGFNYATAAEGSLSPLTLLQSLAPFALGHANDNSYLGAYASLGAWVSQGLSVYVGCAALLLGLWACFGGPPKAKAFAWALLLLLLYALGHWTPVHRLFYELPVFSHFRAPMKAAHLSAFLLGMLAAYGLQALLSGRLDRGRVSRGAAVMALILGALAAGLQWGAAPLERAAKPRVEARAALADASASEAYYLEKLTRWREGTAKHFAFQAGVLALLALFLFLTASFGKGLPKERRELVLGLSLCALAFGELHINGHHYFPTLPKGFYDRVPENAELLKAELSPEDPFRVFGWGWSELLKKASPGGVENADQAAAFRVAALLGDSRTLGWGIPNFSGYSPLPLARVESLLGNVNDYKPAEELHRQTQRLGERREALDQGAVRYILSALPLDWPGLKLIKDEEVRVYENLRARPMARLDGEGSIRWKERSDEAWVLEVHAPKGGMLKLSRAHYEGLFEAKVEGQKAPLEADGAFTSVRVGPGGSRVEIRLQDPLLPWGRALSALGHAILVLAALAMIFQARNRHGRATATRPQS